MDNKPIAWMNRHNPNEIHPDDKFDGMLKDSLYIPLYTTPQTKPLSDEEIKDEVLKDKYWDWQGNLKYLEFARAIEAKVRGDT
jgi:hypothetical protein